MNVKKNFYLFLASIPALAALAAACNLAEIRTQWYVWEVLLDGKTIALAALFILLLRPNAWRSEAQKMGVFRWSIVKSAGAFLIPALLSCAITAAGLLLKKVSYADPDNAATVILTMVFDIPAILIFSVTTVLIEECLFRGYIFAEFVRNGLAATGLCLSSLLWAVYAAVDVLPLEEFSWLKIGLVLLFLFAVGIASAVLFYASRSIWLSYAFRVGVITITPLVLSGATGETDAFFGTDNILFMGDGIVASVLLVLVFTSIFFVVHAGRKKRTAAAYAVE